MAPMPDDEWEEVAQTVPSVDELFIQKYLSGRDALIAQEKKQRSDYAFRQSLSPIARDACAIVARIREEERSTIWTPQLDAAVACESETTAYPGMMFGLAKETMEKTRLWRIIRQMPKGALLHAHMDAMVDFDFLIDKTLETPGMCIFCETDLATPEKAENGLIRFCYLYAEPKETNIWETGYKSSEPMLLTRAAKLHPDGREGFVKYLKSKFTISREESLQHYHGVDHVWRRFQSIFAMLSGITAYEPIFRAFVQRMMSLLNADGVKWVDLRLAFVFRFHKEGKETPEKGYVEMFRILEEEVQKFKASEEGKDFWGLRMIWTGLRRLDLRHVIEDMDNCIEVKLAYPNLICGYDLVGQEDLGRPLKDILPELFWFRKQCVDEGVNIPFFFHAGETLGDGSDTDQNIFDAILLGTRRIGHGFSLYKHPLLIDMVKEKKILIESCPISNEVLRLCTSIISHPLPALLARGVSCSLCNDDPAILGQDTAGSTHDFWQALQGWDNLGLAGLGSLAENSVRYAAFEDQTNAEWLEGIKEGSLGQGVRGARMREWALEWEKFCLWVVTEFGDDATGAVKLGDDKA